jgi:hypothetical protein
VLPAQNEKGGWWAATDASRKCTKAQCNTLAFFVKGQGRRVVGQFSITRASSTGRRNAF